VHFLCHSLVVRQHAVSSSDWWGSGAAVENKRHVALCIPDVGSSAVRNAEGVELPEWRQQGFKKVLGKSLCRLVNPGCVATHWYLHLVGRWSLGFMDLDHN